MIKQSRSRLMSLDTKSPGLGLINGGREPERQRGRLVETGSPTNTALEGVMRVVDGGLG